MDERIPWREVDSDEQEFLDWLRQQQQEASRNKQQDISGTWTLETLFDRIVEGIWVDSEESA